MVYNLANAIEVCSTARNEALRYVKTHVERADRRWIRSRSPRLLAIDASGERLDDSSWVEWRRRWGDVVKMSEIPGCVKIIVDSGIDYAATKDDLENMNYDIEYWQAVVWESIPSQ